MTGPKEDGRGPGEEVEMGREGFSAAGEWQGSKGADAWRLVGRVLAGRKGRRQQQKRAGRQKDRDGRSNR